jgi:hypothetical protein
MEDSTYVRINRARVKKGHWDEFEHAPAVLEFPGVMGAKRYRKIVDEQRFQYMVAL